MILNRPAPAPMSSMVQLTGECQRSEKIISENKKENRKNIVRKPSELLLAASLVELFLKKKLLVEADPAAQTHINNGFIIFTPNILRVNPFKKRSPAGGRLRLISFPIAALRF